MTKFADYLGSDLREFISICETLYYQKPTGYSFVELRNGIAHGDTVITHSIGVKEQRWVNDVVFNDPYSILTRILSISKKSSFSHNATETV